MSNGLNNFFEGDLMDSSSDDSGVHGSGSLSFDDGQLDDTGLEEERKRELFENEEAKGYIIEFFDAHLGETFTTEYLFAELVFPDIQTDQELKVVLNDLVDQRRIDIEIIDSTVDPEYGKKE